MTDNTTAEIDKLFTTLRTVVNSTIADVQEECHSLLKAHALALASHEPEQEEFSVDELKFAKASQVLRQAIEEPGPKGFFSRLRRDPSVLIERAYKQMNDGEVIYAIAWARERGYTKRYILGQIAKRYAAHEKALAKA